MSAFRNGPFDIAVEVVDHETVRVKEKMTSILPPSRNWVKKLEGLKGDSLNIHFSNSDSPDHILCYFGDDYPMHKQDCSFGFYMDVRDLKGLIAAAQYALFTLTENEEPKIE